MAENSSVGFIFIFFSPFLPGRFCNRGGTQFWLGVKPSATDSLPAPHGPAPLLARRFGVSGETWRFFELFSRELQSVEIDMGVCLAVWITVPVARACVGGDA